MLHIVLDTSTFRTNPRRTSPAFRTLSALARGGKIKIHVPHVIKREFLSQQYEQIGAALQGLKKQGKALGLTTADPELRKLAEKTQAKAKQQSERIENDATLGSSVKWSNGSDGSTDYEASWLQAQGRIGTGSSIQPRAGSGL